MGALPLDIWADLLEEQGQDTTDLREWLALGCPTGSMGYGDARVAGTGVGHIYGALTLGCGSPFGYDSRYSWGRGPAAFGEGSTQGHGAGYLYSCDAR